MLPRGEIAAAVLTLLVGAIALTIGLYRPEVCLDRKRLLIATGLAAIVTFVVLLPIGVGPHNGSGDGSRRRRHIICGETHRRMVRRDGRDPPGLRLCCRRRFPDPPHPAGRRSRAGRRPDRPPALPPRPAVRAGGASRRHDVLAVTSPPAHLACRGRLRTRGTGCRIPAGLQAPRHAGLQRRRVPRDLSRPHRSRRADRERSPAGPGLRRRHGRRAAETPVRHRHRRRHAGPVAAADGAHRAGGQNRQPRTGALPPAAGRTVRQHLHPVQVPQHDRRRRSRRRSALGAASRIRGSPGSAASSAPPGSTNCRNWQTSSVAK